LKKKIIFVGPPETGKTTLRKIFFEGENASSLLQNALKPTRGKESIIIELKDSIGVFDLGGQDNELWFTTDKKEIFFDTRIIIAVVDVNASFQEILNFFKRVIGVRNTLTPSTFIYFLVHKIDLLKQRKLAKLKSQLYSQLKKEELIKIAYSSIQKEYLDRSFALFIDILQMSISDELLSDQIEMNFLKNSFDLFFNIHREKVISRKLLSKNLVISDEMLNQIITKLIDKGYIRVLSIDNKIKYSLTDSGEEYFKKISMNLPLDGKRAPINYGEMEVTNESEFPPFLGFLLGDKYGKNLMECEVNSNIFDIFLKQDNETKGLETDLIAGFINALESFSKELNIKNLPGFTLQGTNIQMKTFNLELVTIIFLMNSTTNYEVFKSEITEWFSSFVNKNESEIKYAAETGDVSKIRKLDKEGMEFFGELNNRYVIMANKLEIFDLKKAQELYKKIDTSPNNLNLQDILQFQKYKKLKLDLTKATLEKNFQNLRDVEQRFGMIKT